MHALVFLVGAFATCKVHDSLLCNVWVVGCSLEHPRMSIYAACRKEVRGIAQSVV